MTIARATVDVKAGNKDKGGHNTDAFDVSSSTGLTIKNSKIDNQDVSRAHRELLVSAQKADVLWAGLHCHQRRYQPCV